MIAVSAFLREDRESRPARASGRLQENCRTRGDAARTWAGAAREGRADGHGANSYSTVPNCVTLRPFIWAGVNLMRRAASTAFSVKPYGRPCSTDTGMTQP